MANLTSIRRVDAKKLIPYKNNAKKHSDSQIEKLANSIKEIGFISPILIDKEFNVIAGHGRLMAAQKLNLDKVPCAFVEGLTEAQRRAYILADNRLAEFGQWDNELVAVEIGELETMDLGFDISDFDFPEYKEPESDLGSYYGDERERTNDAYNLDIAHNSELTKDFWQMPVIENDGFVPERLIGFNYAKSSDDKAKFLEAVKKDPGLTFHTDGTIDIDFTKVANKPLVQAVMQNFGFKSVGVPDEMDSELYDKLTAHAPDAPDGGAARTAHLEKIATGFGADSTQY
jgi:hypothetical protein